MLSFADFFRPPKESKSNFCGVAKHGTRRQISKGAPVAPTNNPPGEILFLLDGSLRVEHHGSNGHLLYRLQGGADGILLTNCTGWHQDHTVDAVAETDLDLLSLSQQAFESLMATSGQFRGLIFQANSKRMLALLQDAENAAFV